MNVGTPFISNTKASELMQPSDRSLHHPAQLPQALIFIGAATREQRLNPLHVQHHFSIDGVIRLVGDHRMGSSPRRADLAAHGVDAEVVRDIHLDASGLLSHKIGGESVYPPLPGFVTEVGRSVKWPESEGEDRYRRGLYIFLKRTILYPALTSFDAPATDVSCSRRDRSNSPMQALTLLNDPVYLEIAEAFASLDRRPARSVMFVLVSGEEKGLLGSQYFVENPPVPVGQMVANINLDMIGRNAPDTVVAIGLDYSSLGPALRDIAGRHPELGLTIAPDLWPEERLFFRSDHFSFAAREVPAIFLTTGLHDDYHRPSDEPETIDDDKAMRIARLLFRYAHELAGAPQRPQWTTEGLAEVRRATR